MAKKKTNSSSEPTTEELKAKADEAKAEAQKLKEQAAIDLAEAEKAKAEAEQANAELEALRLEAEKAKALREQAELESYKAAEEAEKLQELNDKTLESLEGAKVVKSTAVSQDDPFKMPQQDATDFAERFLESCKKELRVHKYRYKVKITTRNPQPKTVDGKQVMIPPKHVERDWSSDSRMTDPGEIGASYLRSLTIKDFDNPYGSDEPAPNGNAYKVEGELLGINNNYVEPENRVVRHTMTPEDIEAFNAGTLEPKAKTVAVIDYTPE